MYKRQAPNTADPNKYAPNKLPAQMYAAVACVILPTELHALTTGNPDLQAIGSWARYLGLGTQAEADDEQS